MSERIRGLPTRAARLKTLSGAFKAEIAAEPKLMAAQPEMKIVAAGSADPFGETGADGRAAAAEADGAVPAAKAVAHRSTSSAFTADPHAQAGVAKTPSTGTQAAMTKAAADEAAAKACMAKAPATEGPLALRRRQYRRRLLPQQGPKSSRRGQAPPLPAKRICASLHSPRHPRASVLVGRNAASFGEFELGSESVLATLSRIWAITSKKRHWRWVAVLANALPATGLWLSGGRLRAFSRSNSGNSELYRRLAKMLQSRDGSIDNCRSAKRPVERGTNG